MQGREGVAEAANQSTRTSDNTVQENDMIVTLVWRLFFTYFVLLLFHRKHFLCLCVFVLDTNKSENMTN